MKRIILTLLAMLTLLVPLGPQTRVHAVDLFNVCSDSTNGTNCTDCKGAAASTDVCNTVSASHGNPIMDAIKITIDIISYAIGVAAIIMLIINGFKLVTSGGDAKAVEEGRKGVTYALVGVAVAIVAQVLVQYVLNKL